MLNFRAPSSHPELSLPIATIRDGFLNLAELIIRRESADTRSRHDHPTEITWYPPNENIFAEQIKLSRILVTANPMVRPDFKVVEALFELRGDNAMSMKISKQMDSLNDDPLAIMLLEQFSGSYLGHHHYDCIREVRLRRQEELRRGKIRDKIEMPPSSSIA